MNIITFQVIYKSKFYEFEDGLKVFLFQLGVFNDFDKKHGITEMLKYILLTYESIRADCNSTEIENFAEFVARKWNKVKKMSRYELLEYYYKDNNN